MSFYATVQGEIIYSDADRLQGAVISLNDSKYMKGNNFIDECGNVVNENGSDVDGLTLRIPPCVYHNLSYIVEDLTEDAKGRVVWTSTDGCFAGGVFVDGKETYYDDLEEWAVDNMPEEDAEAPDIYDDTENWLIWAADVEQAFHEEMMEWQ